MCTVLVPASAGGRVFDERNPRRLHIENTFIKAFTDSQIRRFQNRNGRTGSTIDRELIFYSSKTITLDP